MNELNKKLKKQLGFTLIELMIVVAIIGILAAIAIPNFLRFQAKAKQSEARIILSGIYTAQTAYFAEQNTYNLDLVNKVGFQPASTPKYYVPAGTTYFDQINSYMSNAGAAAFSAQASGNIDSETTVRDVWTVDSNAREPQNPTNDVVVD